MFFRLLVLFFTVATIVLSSWSLVGSYKNESYLTDNYLLAFQLSNLNFSAIVKQATKRDFVPVPMAEPPTPTAKKRDIDIASITANLDSYTSLAGAIATGGTSELASLASANSVATSDIGSLLSSAAANPSGIAAIASSLSIPESVATLAAEILSGSSVSSVLEDLVGSVNASELGLADMYNVGFFGYCRGWNEGETEEITELGKFGKQFSNTNVNYTYCSPPKVGYKLDPLTLLKHEILVQLEDYFNETSAATDGLTDTVAAELLSVVSSLTYDDIGLPGSLETSLDLLHNMTIAGFSLILAGACLAFISFLFQCVGLCCSPNNSCLSCCNFLLMLLVFLVVLVGSILSTAAYMIVRKEVNNNLDEYGAKTYLSIQFYAFSWSAVVAALLFLVLSVIGYCCGCFHSKRSRQDRNSELRYVHKG